MILTRAIILHETSSNLGVACSTQSSLFPWCSPDIEYVLWFHGDQYHAWPVVSDRMNSLQKRPPNRHAGSNAAASADIINFVRHKISNIGFAHCVATVLPKSLA